MANIDTITFTNVPLTTLGLLPLTSYSGSLTVNYDTGEITGALQVAPALGIDLTNYSSFTLVPGAGGNYTITGTGQTAGLLPSTISLQFNGQAPSLVDTQYFVLGIELALGTNGSAVSAPVCFASGTAIRTARGAIRVEHLAVGDLVVTVSGKLRPIRWLGHRVVDCRRQASAQPIRIAADAFGLGLPARDLLLSPGHPVLVDADEDGEGGYLVPIMCLINGTTIERVSIETVTYWHVELDQHDILLAEGLSAESYLDWGDRVFFTENVDHALLNPDFVVPGLGARCRPVAIDGEVVRAERRRVNSVFATRLSRPCAWPGDTIALGF